MGSKTARWYLVHCKPREDERALEHLQRQGFECYRPTRAVERRREGSKVFAQEPLFPRYIFIRLDYFHDNWYPIHSTRGVHALVRFNNEKPLPVPDHVIDDIRARLANPSPDPYLKPGERVLITDGPFSHFEAIFISSDGDQRVVLLMNILNQEQQVRFPAGSVRKIA